MALGFAVVAQVGAMAQVDHQRSVLPQTIFYVALAILLSQTLITHARGRSSDTIAVLAGPLLVAASQALAVPPTAAALALATLAVQSLYASRRQSLVCTLSAAAGPPVLIVLDHLLGIHRETPAAALIPLPIILVFSALMRALYNSLVAQQQDGRRQALLARTGQELLGLTDPAVVAGIVREAAAQLCRLTPGLQLTLVPSADGAHELVAINDSENIQITSAVETLSTQLTLAEATCASHDEFVQLSNSAVVRANREMVRRGTLLAEAQQIADVGSFVVEAASGEMEWSAQMHRIFGTDADQGFQPTLASYYRLIHPEDRDAMTAAVDGAIAGGRPFEVEHRLVKASGEMRILLARGRADLDDDGTLIRLNCTELDVTAARRLEQELQAALTSASEARDQAVSANAAKSAFLAAMSHEIRTPMNAVLAIADLLADTTLDSSQFDLITTIRNGGDQLMVIIRDILDFTKIEANELDLDVKSFDLRDLVETAVRPMVIEETGLDLVVTVEDDCPAVVVTDPARLRQVIGNLVNNAVKFTHRGGIRVQVSCEETLPDGDVRLRFAVQDTGIGIPEDSLDRLFKSFSQVEEGNTRSYGGAGLGLVISQALVRALGGDIRVESQPGVGSTFSFTVKAGVGVPAAPVKSTPTARKLKILLAEDNAVNQKVASLLLRKLGYTVQIVDNGEKAADVARAEVFDVVLMDLHMPVMDGLEATRRIRAEAPADHQPHIIALTASVTLEDRNACFTAGMDAFLSKPVRLEDLRTALTEV